LESIERSDIFEIQTIVEEMIGVLQTIQNNADWLRRLVQLNAKSLDASWTDALSRLPIPEERRDFVRLKITNLSGFFIAGRDWIENAIRLAVSEVQDLRQKIRSISSGDLSRGDMSKEGTCAMYGVVAILAFLTVGGAEFGALVGAIGAAECL
jgi:hypothetical protein